MASLTVIVAGNYILLQSWQAEITESKASDLVRFLLQLSPESPLKHYHGAYIKYNFIINQDGSLEVYSSNKPFYTGYARRSADRRDLVTFNAYVEESRHRDYYDDNSTIKKVWVSFFENKQYNQGDIEPVIVIPNTPEAVILNNYIDMFHDHDHDEFSSPVLRVHSDMTTYLELFKAERFEIFGRLRLVKTSYWLPMIADGLQVLNGDDKTYTMNYFAGELSGLYKIDSFFKYTRKWYRAGQVNDYYYTYDKRHQYVSLIGFACPQRGYKYEFHISLDHSIYLYLSEDDMNDYRSYKLYVGDGPPYKFRLQRHYHHHHEGQEEPELGDEVNLLTFTYDVEPAVAIDSSPSVLRVTILYRNVEIDHQNFDVHSGLPLSFQPPAYLEESM